MTNRLNKPIYCKCSNYFASRVKRHRSGLCFGVALVPEGRRDHSLARSAWDSVLSKEPSHRGMIRKACGPIQ